jgi:transcriptional regulator with XRE-family HTH domain
VKDEHFKQGAALPGASVVLMLPTGPVASDRGNEARMTRIRDFLSSRQGGNEQLAEERLIVAVTEAVSEEMERKGVTKTALAEALGCSKAHVSKLLGGSRNMTLRTLAAIACALDVEPSFGLVSSGEDRRADDDGWETDPKLVGKVVRLCPRSEVTEIAANDDEGWSQPRPVLGGC